MFNRRGGDDPRESSIRCPRFTPGKHVFPCPFDFASEIYRFRRGSNTSVLRNGSGHRDATCPPESQSGFLRVQGKGT